MIQKQPTAIYLAEQVKKGEAAEYSISIAAELRRLHEVNAVMRRTLECISNNGKIVGMVGFTEWAVGAANAAIAKAEGGAA